MHDVSPDRARAARAPGQADQIARTSWWKAIRWLGDERCARVFARAASLGTVVSAQRTRISTVPPLIGAVRPYPGLRFVVYEVLCERFGVQRVAWGSYSMFTGAEPDDSLGSVLAEMRASFSFLSPGELSWVLGRTAAQLFWQ